jgi:NitT/TauT family transport system substrate-binding protein
MRQNRAHQNRRQVWCGLAVAICCLVVGCAPPPVPASVAQPLDAPPGPAADAGPKPAAEAPPGPPVTVRSGLVGSVAEAGQLIALERGYFQEQGLAVEFTQFDTTAHMTPSLATGQLDVGAGGVSAGLFNAIARGVPIRIVGPQAQHDPGASAVYLMVRKDLIESGQFRSYEDLRGRRVAIPGRGTPPDFAAALALARAGLRPEDTEFVELTFPDMIAAFANQGIDVAVQAEPAAARAVSRGVAVKWREMADIRPGIQFTVVLYAPQFAQDTEAARRWMVAYLRGVRDYNDAFKKNRGRAEIVEILTRQTSVKDPGLYEEMGFAYIDPNGRVEETGLTEQLQWYREQGLVTEAADLKQVLDLGFADFALQRLGRYE